METPSRNPLPAPTSGAPSGLFRTAPHAMLVVDGRTHRILEVNQALTALVDQPAEQLVGAPLLALDAGGIGDVSEYVLLAAATGDDQARRRTFRTGRGDEMAVEVRAVPLSESRSTSVLLVVRDARAEQAHEMERGRLETQLWMAQKHETIGKLAAGLAHDFSNLLSVVLLTADSLRDRLDGDPQLEADLDLITDAGFRARELTVELLAFTGQAVQAIDPKPVALNQLLGEMEPLLRRALPESIELVTQCCEGQAAVNADPTQIQQVILNLVVNAREAMPEGGTLMVSTQEVEVDEDRARELGSVRPGPHILLSVSDTGPGMDEETRTRIFDPFFTPRGRRQGSGLGMATVQGIIRQTGGSIHVTSEPGAGSNYRIHLPRRASAPRRSVGPRGVRVGGLPGGSEHILLVEDDANVRNQAMRILQELGYEVTAAAGPDAAALIHDDLWPERGPHPVDLILTDVVMPGMSGVELVRRVRTKREDVPALFMSGYLDPMAEGGTNAGRDTYLPKPFTRDELARSVRMALGSSGTPVR